MTKLRLVLTVDFDDPEWYFDPENCTVEKVCKAKEDHCNNDLNHLMELLIEICGGGYNCRVTVPYEKPNV